MKNLIILIYLLFGISVYSQSVSPQYDIRKANWGMPITEVMSSEYPLTPTLIKDNSIEYDNVELSNGLKALLYFGFKNKRLEVVSYTIQGYPGSPKGTCKNIIPLCEKVNDSKFIIEALQERGLKCRMGWYFENCAIGSFPLGNCSLECETVEKIERIASSNGCSHIILSLETARNDVQLHFWQYQNQPETYKFLYPDCNDRFYNEFCIVQFHPNSKVKKQMDKGDF